MMATIYSDAIDISLQDANATEENWQTWKNSDDLTDLVIAGRGGPLGESILVDSHHTDRYPRLKLSSDAGSPPTWHLKACVPTTTTPEALKAELAQLFGAAGWKVL